MINRKAVSGRAESRKPKLPRPQCDSQFSHLLLFQPQDWERSVFIPIPKKGNAKECSNYCTIAHISHASKVMLKILKARLQQYVNHEIPDVQIGLGKAEEPEIKLPTSVGLPKKQESSRKTSTSALLTMPKPLTVWTGKFFKRWEYQTT